MNVSKRAAYVLSNAEAGSKGERWWTAEAAGERSPLHVGIHETKKTVTGNTHQLHQLWMRKPVQHAPLGTDLIHRRKSHGRSHGLVLVQPLDGNGTTITKHPTKHSPKSTFPNAIVWVEIVGGKGQVREQKFAQAIFLALTFGCSNSQGGHCICACLVLFLLHEQQLSSLHRCIQLSWDLWFWSYTSSGRRNLHSGDVAFLPWRRLDCALRDGGSTPLEGCALDQLSVHLSQLSKKIDFNHAFKAMYKQLGKRGMS